MKRALIITYYWPSAGGSGVQRWLKFVKYFREFGVEPIVYTVENPNYPIIDESLSSDIPTNIEVLTQPIWEPNNVLSFFGKNKNESAGFLNSNPSFFGKILQYIRANYFVPDARIFWVKPSVNFLKKYLTENKIDVLITTGPPHSMHLIGLKLKQQLGLKWIADFRDPWTEIDYFHQLPLSKNAVKKHHHLEQQVLKNADTVLVVGNTMKSKFKKFNKNVVTVTNGFDGDLEDSNIELDKKFSWTHVGLMNADRNPTMLWQVLSEICKENAGFKYDFQLKLIGKVDDSIRNNISKYNLSKNVEYIDYVPHNKVIEFQKKSQMLLLVVNNVPSAKGIITGKIFEYLMAKRPIVAIAPKNGDLAEILYETKAGIVVDFEDSRLLKKTIVDLYTQFKNENLKIESINVEKYHRKQLSKRVAEIINQITE